MELSVITVKTFFSYLVLHVDNLYLAVENDVFDSFYLGGVNY